MLKRRCFVIALFLVAATGSLKVIHGGDNTNKLRVGDPLPDFVLDDAHGNHYELRGTSDAASPRVRASGALRAPVAWEGGAFRAARII